jgi:hypothetical protein
MLIQTNKIIIQITHKNYNLKKKKKTINYNHYTSQ